MSLHVRISTQTVYQVVDSETGQVVRTTTDSGEASVFIGLGSLPVVDERKAK